MSPKASVIWWIVLAHSMLRVDVNCTGRQELVDQMRAQIARELGLYTVTVMHRSPGHLSPTHALLLSEISNGFPTLLVNVSGSLEGVSRLLGLRSQRRALNIILLDEGDDGPQVSEALIAHLDFLVKFSPRSPRAKCIVVVDDCRDPLDLEAFFEYAWRHGFLNIAVVELRKSSGASVSGDTLLAILHSYNPFEKDYKQESFSEESALFVNKLRNLKGFPLRVGMFDDIPKVIISREGSDNRTIWDVVEGIDVFITKALAQALNFSLEVRVIDSDNPLWERFNISKEFIDDAITGERIDFAVNLYGIIGSSLVEDLFFEPSIVLRPFAGHLIIKQYGRSEIRISYNLAITASAVVTSVVMTIASVIWLLKLKSSRTWTTYNVTMLLMSNSVGTEPRRIYERIIFLCLLFVGSAHSLQIIERIVANCTWQESFPDIRTLQELLDRGIVPSITNDTKNVNTHNMTVLRKLFDLSKTISSEKEAIECVKTLVSESRSVNGCEVDDLLGPLIAKSFGHGQNGWIISFVKETLVQTCWSAMVFTKTTPYVEGFDPVLRRLVESGLLDFWTGTAVHRFMSYIRPPETGSSPLRLTKPKRASNARNILLVYVTGQLMACTAFLVEVSIGYLGRARRGPPNLA